MTTLSDTLDTIDADNRKRRQHALFALFVVGLAVLAGAAIDGSQHREDAHRFTCYAERSATVEQVEIIYYPKGFQRTQPGVEVACPK